MNKKQFFVDGVENVSVVSGLVRVDFFTYEATPHLKEKEEPKREHSFRLLLSPDSFIQTYSSCGRLMDELKKRGLVVSRDKLDSDISTDSASQDNKEKKQENRKSPNFEVSGS